ncbi:MAG TPA: hypothetical protein VG938_09050 [Verrucomicrobiae bacterium]|nr:hypothetical protein [Verrucomicrobiae bacterium]
MSASAASFGTIPGTTAAQNPYSGHGIPIDTSEYAQFTGLGGGDTLTIAMAATQNGSNPAPGNDKAGTYFVNTGLVGGKSVWNFDFYGSSQLGLLANYVFTLTETANGHTFSFNPATIADDGGAPNAFGNSERLDFATYGGPLGYNANADDTYDFTLSVSTVTGSFIGSDNITVVAGRGAAAPDTASTATLLGAAFLGLFLMKRRFTRSVA